MSGAPIPLSDTKRKLEWFGKDDKYFSAALPGTTLEYQKTQEDAYYNAKNNVLLNKNLPKFMITVGTEDFLVEACRMFHKELKSLGYEATFTEIPGFGHEWDFWDSELKKAFDHFFTI